MVSVAPHLKCNLDGTHIVVEFVRDDRFRHLSQVPSQDGSDIMSSITRLLPIQVLPILFTFELEYENQLNGTNDKMVIE
jgi:hypothetical protein